MFAGSRLVGGADADLIAAGLLLDLKAGSKKLALPQEDMFQVLSPCWLIAHQRPNALGTHAGLQEA